MTLHDPEAAAREAEAWPQEPDDPRVGSFRRTGAAVALVALYLSAVIIFLGGVHGH